MWEAQQGQGTSSFPSGDIREAVDGVAVQQAKIGDTPAGKAITQVLPKPARKVKHYPALPYKQVPEALNKIKESSSGLVTRLAFEFLVLTAARSQEVRLARWPEVDWNKDLWAIPGEEMKAWREHKVPLSHGLWKSWWKQDNWAENQAT